MRVTIISFSQLLLILLLVDLVNDILVDQCRLLRKVIDGGRWTLHHILPRVCVEAVRRHCRIPDAITESAIEEFISLEAFIG